MSLERARSEIVRAFPAFAVYQISFLGAGVDSEAYLVNGMWVFRFPKREAVSLALAREITLLPHLAERLPVAAPHFEYVGRQVGNELLFVGYRLIPGEPLEPELFDALPSAVRDGILRTLAQFIDAVHAFPLDAAQAAGVEPLSTRDLVRSAWAEARSLTLAQLSPADGAELAALIEGFLGDDRNVSEAPCLLYADFAPEHILYDRASERVTGIIDWGDLAIGDPDYDLTYLHQDYGAAFVERLLTHLPHPDPDRLFTKLRVFGATDYLRDVANARASTTADGLSDTLDGLRDLLAAQGWPSRSDR